MQKQKLCKFIVTAFMLESYKMSALFRPQRQNRMKRQRRQIKIHFNRTIIAVNHPLYTFQPESMSLVVVFTGNQSPAGTGKRIGETGVYDRDNGKRRVRPGIGVQFNKTIRNGSSPQCVVEEIAEQCRQIRIRQKINRVAADIRVKGNLPRFALICITAQNSIEQRNITALQ